MDRKGRADRGRSRSRSGVRKIAGQSARAMSVSRSRSRGAYRPLYRIGGRLPFDSRELKDITTHNVVTVPALGVNTAVLTLINGVAQGTTATTRNGRRIFMKSLMIRFSAIMANTSGGATAGRIMVVYDKQSNATAPAATDILLADSIISVNNLGNSKRFVTIWDKLIPCIGSAGPQSVLQAKYKVLNLPVDFNIGSAGTIGDIQTGSLYIMIYTNATITTAATNWAFDTRVRFSDA